MKLILIALKNQWSKLWGLFAFLFLFFDGLGLWMFFLTTRGHGTDYFMLAMGPFILILFTYAEYGEYKKWIRVLVTGKPTGMIENRYDAALRLLNAGPFISIETLDLIRKNTKPNSIVNDMALERYTELMKKKNESAAQPA